ncbi:FkbM family methyltransferase [Nostoc sp.]|uniref:FkbM family methyltransferase n=1 Tax=Nostoc sp. TaxID=1180 RepID=UPI002FFD0B45
MNLWWVIDNFYNKNPKFRKFIMKSLFGNKTIQVTLFDTELMINSIKENGYYRASRLCNISSLLRDEVSVILNIAGLLSENDTFVDIGANVGIFSSILSRYQKLFPDRQIYAFEANPDTYERLKINSKKYGFKAYNIGISDRECELEFIEGVVSHVFTTVENASRYNIKDKITNIKCQRLDKFEIPGKSLILKIDVEGQELQVLRGASSFFDEQRIKAVYLDGYSDKGVLDFLSAYNFSLWDGRKLLETDGDLFSLLAILPEKLREKLC